MITIVVPIYNGAPFIPQFVELLKRQTYKDFEVVFVCDESPDGSIDLLKEQVKANDIKAEIILRKERGGIGSARDYAINNNLLQGEYSLFMDVDDIFTDDYLERLHANAKKFDSDIAICAFKRANAKDGSVISVEMTNYPDVISPVGPSLPVALINPAPWNKLIRTSIIQDCRFVASKREDVMFFTKLIPYCKTISFIQEPLYFYQVSDSSDIAKDALDALHIGQRGMVDVRNFYSERYETHASFFPLLIGFAFLRVGIGMTTRACISVSKKERRGIANSTLAYLDKEFRGWRYTKMLSFWKMAKLGFKGLLLWNCKILMKMHLFPLFVSAYVFYTRTFHRDIKW